MRKVYCIKDSGSFFKCCFKGNWYEIKEDSDTNNFYFVIYAKGCVIFEDKKFFITEDEYKKKLVKKRYEQNEDDID